VRTNLRDVVAAMSHDEGDNEKEVRHFVWPFVFLDFRAAAERVLKLKNIFQTRWMERVLEAQLESCEPVHPTLHVHPSRLCFRGTSAEEESCPFRSLCRYCAIAELRHCSVQRAIRQSTQRFRTRKHRVISIPVVDSTIVIALSG
jgi:hypothetical protein